MVYVPSRPEDDPLFRYLDGVMRERLTTAINELPERERPVMTLYYYEGTTMTEIGLILVVVESRVSQIHASAVLHLRARLKMPTALKEPQNKPGETTLKEHVWEKLGSGSRLIPHDLL
jgi:DNA-directed RNA polymerase specialized sigma24 family protein